MQHSAVVVGIATHNRADLLRKVISSVLDQNYRPLRIAIVDDGSSDHTPALRKEFAELSWERWNDAQGYVKARGSRKGGRGMSPVAPETSLAAAMCCGFPL